MNNIDIQSFENFDERELVEAATSNAEAMCVLYRRHYGTIQRYVSRRVATAHDVNDIVSDVFLIMVRDVGRFRWTGAPFQCWLLRVANSQIQRWVRKRKLMRFWAPFDDQYIENDVEQRDFDQVYLLRKSLLELPCRYQDALSLFYLEDMSVLAIANVLNVPEGTVKARLSRGRALLKDKLHSYPQRERKHEQRAVGTMLGRTQT